MAKAKVRLSLDRLSISERIALTRTIVTQSTVSPYMPTPTTPPLAALNAGATCWTRSSWPPRWLGKRRKPPRPRSTMPSPPSTNCSRSLPTSSRTRPGTTRKRFVHRSAGAGPSTPIGELSQVENLAVTVGDDAGELDGEMGSRAGGKTYRVETSPDPITANSWSLAEIVSARRSR